MDKNVTSQQKIPEIKVDNIEIENFSSQSGLSVKENLLEPRENPPEDNVFHDSTYLDLPNRNKSIYKQRQSIISRQSIELFLSKFPENETEYADREIFSTVREIMRSNLGIRKDMKCNEKAKIIIQSHKFHLFYIGLVIIDCVCVIVQMILDIIHKEINHEHILHYLEEGAEIFSVVILSLFLLSIILHAFLIPKIYFKSKLEMFDALIVIVSFILDIISIVNRDSVKEIEAAVITLRFIFFCCLKNISIIYILVNINLQ